MASDTNQVTIVGRLTRDPELRSLASGQSLCEIGVAVNSTKKTQSGEWEDEAHFFNVTCWGRKEGGGLSETVSKYCGKGDRVIVSGRLQQQRWEADNGDKRERVGIVANSVQFLTTKAEREGNGQSAQQAPASTPPSQEAPF